MHALDITASRKEGMLVHFTYQNPVLLRPDQPLVTCQLCHAHQGVWVHLSWQLVTPTRPCLQSARAWVLRVSGPGRSLVYKDKVAIRLGPLCSCSSEAPPAVVQYFFFFFKYVAVLSWFFGCLPVSGVSQKREADPLYIAENGNKELSSRGQCGSHGVWLPSAALE